MSTAFIRNRVSVRRCSPRAVIQPRATFSGLLAAIQSIAVGQSAAA